MRTQSLSRKGFEKKSTKKTHKDHIADRGHVSTSHYNMVHKQIPIPKAMPILEAKAALDKECVTLQKPLAWDESKVKSTAEVIR